MDINYNLLITQMLDGMGYTLTIFGLTILFSIPIGLILAFGKISRFKVISVPVNLYILLMRGTPLMLQLMFIFFGVPALGFAFDRLTACIIAFSLNYAAYFAEIFRGGIQSIPKGQYEASKVLGFSKTQTFIHIVSPQVIKNILPAMGNEFITLVKDTSLARVISVTEIMFVVNSFANSAVSIIPFVFAAIFYLVLNGIVTITFNLLEKKLNYYK